MKVRIVVGDLVHDITVPKEWLDGPRGWELLGAKGWQAHEAALSGLQPVDDEDDEVPAVRTKKAAKA